MATPAAHFDLAAPTGVGVSQALVSAAFERHNAALVRALTARTGDPELAADIAQESFLRLLRHSAVGPLPASVPAWLARVSINIVRDRHRRTRVADRREPALWAGTPTDESPEDAVLRAERDGAIRRAMAGLAVGERDALEMSARGFGAQEIAQAIGRTEGATRTFLCRARSKVRAALIADRSWA